MVHIAINNETDRQRALDTISALPAAQGMWVEINDKPKRSQLQHRLYWEWLRIIHRETQNDLDALHEYFKAKYLGLGDLQETFGAMIEVPVSTTSLSVAEFAEYLNKIEAFCLTELGISLPHDDGT